jgi:sporulation protein YlmC with PRC-barrel domain
MNVRNLGIPIYENGDGAEYVLLEDLKLALDRDQYERVAVKVMSNEVYVKWLEGQR